MATRAAGFIAQIRRNAQDYHVGRTTYEAFTQAQRAVWDAVDAAGLRYEVTLAVTRRCRPADRRAR